MGCVDKAPLDTKEGNTHGTVSIGVEDANFSWRPKTASVNKGINFTRKSSCIAIAIALVFVATALVIGLTLGLKENDIKEGGEISLQVTKSTQDEVVVSADGVGVFTLAPRAVSFVAAEEVDGVQPGFSVPFPGDLLLRLTDGLALILAEFLLAQLRGMVEASIEEETSGNGTRRLDSPGCDWVIDSPCNLGCCAVHDECYDLNKCTALSWAKSLCGDGFTQKVVHRVVLGRLGVISCIAASLFRITSACAQCNNEAVACIVSGCSGITNPTKNNKCYDNKCHEYFDCRGECEFFDTSDWYCCGCKTPGTFCRSPASCGNGICDDGENTKNCKVDCAFNTCMNPTDLNCSGICVDPLDDRKNCGACGFSCTDFCVSGTCTCPLGWKRCDGVCIDPMVDRKNCGGCGNTCTDFCVSGACTCPIAWARCGVHCCPPCTDLECCVDEDCKDSYYNKCTGGVYCECTGVGYCDHQGLTAVGKTDFDATEDDGIHRPVGEGSTVGVGSSFSGEDELVEGVDYVTGTVDDPVNEDELVEGVDYVIGTVDDLEDDPEDDAI
jgi:hypothetical protein